MNNAAELKPIIEVLIVICKLFYSLNYQVLLRKKWSFRLAISSVNMPKPQFPVDLITLTEDSLMENFIFLCSVFYKLNCWRFSEEGRVLKKIVGYPAKICVFKISNRNRSKGLKINNKGTRTTVVLLSFLLMLNIFHIFSAVFIAEFEQVNIWWV